ncbi:MAG: hypothetical protein IPJ65_17405 [Archangiaceae bacterium]|nr:hypothetical protein [Archangiaceae bacterium]
MLAGLLVWVVVTQADPVADWAAPPESAKPVSDADGGVQPLPAREAEAAPRYFRGVDAGVVTEEVAVDLPSPDPGRFTWGHLGLMLAGAFGQTGYVGARAEVGAVFGWPRRMAGTVNRAMGPTVGVAADLLAAKTQVRICGGAGVCGSKYQGGLAARFAWNWGVIGTDAVVAPIHQLFFQAVGFLSHNEIPPAPLATGNVWSEHGVRFDVGVVSGILRGSVWPRPGSFVLAGGLYFALSLEWLIVNTADSGRFRGGLSLGLGL